MQELIQFVTNHWILWLIFAVVVLAIAFEELRGKLSAAPSLSSHELVLLNNHEDIVIIDIRSLAAFHKEHILASMCIPFPENKKIDEMIKRLATKKEQQIVLVDSDGTNVRSVAQKLQTAGFAKVSILRGGLTNWKRDGLPVTNK